MSAHKIRKKFFCRPASQDTLVPTSLQHHKVQLYFFQFPCKDFASSLYLMGKSSGLIMYQVDSFAMKFSSKHKQYKQINLMGMKYLCHGYETLLLRILENKLISHTITIVCAKGSIHSHTHITLINKL